MKEGGLNQDQTPSWKFKCSTVFHWAATVADSKFTIKFSNFLVAVSLKFCALATEQQVSCMETKLGKKISCKEFENLHKYLETF